MYKDSKSWGAQKMQKVWAQFYLFSYDISEALPNYGAAMNQHGICCAFAPILV